MKQRNFAGTQPYLFGEDFGAKAKEKLEAAAVQRKWSTHNQAKESWDFQEATPASTVGAEGVANNRQTTMALGKSRKAAPNQKSLPDD